MFSGQVRGAYFGNLKLPADPASAVGVLKGKSNFRQWHSSIQSVLFSNKFSVDLILGTWTEPKFFDSCTVEEQLIRDQQRREWHCANTGTCRFIRETLAPNVIPFVRQYNGAKTLFFNILWLYGEEAGIDNQGGPPVPTTAQTRNVRRGRASLLAALDVKWTLHYLPPPGLTFEPPSPIVPTSISTYASSSSSSNAGAEASTTREAFKPEPTIDPGPSITLIPTFDRMHLSSESNLETILENEEPHPGRRIRISCGHAVGLKHGLDEPPSERSVSPVTLSDSTSNYDEDTLDHYKSTASTTNTARRGKRQASTELEARLLKATKANIVSMWKATKARKLDRLSFSFPLRRMAGSDK